SGAFRTVLPAIQKILRSETDPTLARPAIRVIASFDDPSVVGTLIESWNNFGPSARLSAIDALLDHPIHVPALLAALEQGRVDRSTLDPPHLQKLIESPDAAISGRARKIFNETVPDRRQVLETYRRGVVQPGDVGNGKALFEKNCAICHLPRLGRRIGPD